LIRRTPYTGIIEAMRLFLKYEDLMDGNLTVLGDQLFAGPDPESVEDLDLVRLASLGWDAFPPGKCFVMDFNS
jgi:hypothetical protein